MHRSNGTFFYPEKSSPKQTNIHHINASSLLIGPMPVQSPLMGSKKHAASFCKPNQCCPFLHSLVPLVFFPGWKGLCGGLRLSWQSLHKVKDKKLGKRKICAVQIVPSNHQKCLICECYFRYVKEVSVDPLVFRNLKMFREDKQVGRFSRLSRNL